MYILEQGHRTSLQQFVHSTAVISEVYEVAKIINWTFYVLPQKMTFELDVKRRQSEELFEDDKDWLSLAAAWS